MTLKPEESEKRNQLKKNKPHVYEKIMRYDEKIKRGESISILQFQYDYTCNFRCVHCCITGLRRDKSERCFTVEDAKELSRQADEMGLAHFVITGGEPLVFPDYDEIVKAIDPQKFYISSDTNGWLLDDERARHLKDIGIDKIQLSLDSLSDQEHDAFRRQKGAHRHALMAIDAAQKAGLNLLVQTVVSKQRVRSVEFTAFIKYLNDRKVPVFVTYAKPVGEWAGNLDVLVSKEDMDYVRNLEKKYQVFTHLTPSYGVEQGCIAVKRMVSITKYGDIMPCPYIHTSLGNFFKEPLKDIIDRGLNIKYFGQFFNSCYIAEDRNFINNYERKKIDGRKLPVPCSEVFGKEDMITKDKRRLYR